MSSSAFSNSPSTLDERKEKARNTAVNIDAEEKLPMAVPMEAETKIWEGSSTTFRTFVWFLEHSEYLLGSEIARLFHLNKAIYRIDNEAFWKVQAKRTYPMNENLAKKFMGEGSWKKYYQRCFDLFGQDGELNFVQIVGIAKDIKAWMKENAPSIYESLNDGADVTSLSRYLRHRGCINRGHLAFWTEIDGQNTFGKPRKLDLGFFGGFSFYQNKGNMHLLSIQNILDTIPKFEQFAVNREMWHCIGYGGRSYWHTVETLALLMKDGSLKKFKSGTASVPYPQGGGSFIGFMKWYRDALYKSEFRIEETGAINRMPRNDIYGSETITNGLRIRVRTLYVPETDMGAQVTITYEFELDAAPGQSPPEGILKSRHFEIGENGEIQKVDGPGVIGLYPRIGPGMDVFRYNSCTRFSKNSRDCWMQGSFLFRLASGGDDFRAHISRFYFKWRESPIV